MRLGNQIIDPIAIKLIGRGIPFVLHTGQDASRNLMAKWPDSLILQKPVPPGTADRSDRQLVAPSFKFETVPARNTVEHSGGLLVPAEGLEPPTFGLQNRCSTS